MNRMEVENDEALARWYDSKYRTMGGPWRTPPEDVLVHLHRMRRFSQAPGPLLDVGCGSGDFLRGAHGFDSKLRSSLLVGVDFSAEACRFSAKACPQAVIVRANVAGLDTIVRSGFRWIVSIGSVEHFIDDAACFASLKRLGGGLAVGDACWYFYVPNELWTHRDQPTERTMTDDEWADYFDGFGFRPAGRERIGDNTAFWGTV